MCALLLREGFSAFDDIDGLEDDGVEGVAKLDGPFWGEGIVDDARPNLVLEELSALFEHQVAATLSSALGKGGKQFGEIFAAQVFRDFFIRLGVQKVRTMIVHIVEAEARYVARLIGFLEI